MSQLYPLGKKAILDGDIDLLADDIIALLIDTADETYNAADQFLSDLTGAGIVATSGNLAGKTTTAGVFDADNILVPTVSGDESEAIIIAKDTGVAGTSPLIAWMDLGVAYTPTGVDITIIWHASGLFAI
jgi:hypothetical protein